jgi:hypothetical protein
VRRDPFRDFEKVQAISTDSEIDSTSQTESTAEKIKVHGYEYPLSRSERIQRLLNLYESEDREKAKDLKRIRRERDEYREAWKSSHAKNKDLEKEIAMLKDKVATLQSAAHSRVELATPRYMAYGATAVSGQLEARTPRGMCTPRGYDGMVSTPRGGPSVRGPYRGSIASVSWSSAPGIRWLAIMNRNNVTQTVYGDAPEGSVEDAGIGNSVNLRRGEFLRQISGAIGPVPHIARWLRLETSEGQVAYLGEPQEIIDEEEPDFTFSALPDQEITAIETGENGAISGIRQSPLPPSRLSGVHALASTPQGSGAGEFTPRTQLKLRTMSRIKEAFSEPI